MNQLDIMMEDLTEEAQIRVRNFYSIDAHDITDGNYDIFPLFVLTKEE